MKKSVCYIMLSFFFSTSLFAIDTNIDQLLNAISIKDDLSQKTKMENGGISYVYTRDDLRRMQAHTLNDVLKSTYPFGYNENRFGLPDPNYNGTTLPFSSSNIRVYIDDQEMTNGLYGSGIIIYGDMDIDFVDHIEVYSGNPTFEYSTESAFTIVKLYSKVAQKDEGSKVFAGFGSRGTTYTYGYDTRELDNGWSYFAYASYFDKNRKKYQNYDSLLSRDSQTKHFFSSIYNDNNKILIDAITQDRDTFISNSVFATPGTSTADVKYFHLGYNSTYGNFSYILTADEYKGGSDYIDNNITYIKAIDQLNSLSLPYDGSVDFDTQSYTAGIKYNLKSKTNKFLTGIKLRYKHFTYDKMIINDIQQPKDDHTTQTISTIFLEDSYSIDDNKIATAGITYADVSNNHSNQDNRLFSYRLGYTYTNKKLVSKSIISHIETTLDPYLVNNSMYLQYPNIKIPKTKQDIFMQDFKYKIDKNLYELIASYILTKDRLLPNKNGKLETYDRTIKMKSALFRFTKEYSIFDKSEFTCGVNFADNVPVIGNLKQYAATLKSFNTYKKFDFFNEILFYRDDVDRKNFYDYSAGIIYHKNEDLSFSIKGTNIFNKARKTSYARISLTNLTKDTPLEISPTDRTILFSVEYTF